MEIDILTKESVGGFWQFYKFLENHTLLNTYSESEVLELKLTENDY